MPIDDGWIVHAAGFCNYNFLRTPECYTFMKFYSSTTFPLYLLILTNKKMHTNIYYSWIVHLKLVSSSMCNNWTIIIKITRIMRRLIIILSVKWSSIWCNQCLDGWPAEKRGFFVISILNSFIAYLILRLSVIRDVKWTNSEVDVV